MKNTILLGVLVASLIAITSFDSAFAQAPTEIDIMWTIGSSVPGCEEANECWSIAEITINVGDTVNWVNADTETHTVTSGSGWSQDGLFDSGNILPGNTFSVTFAQNGTYRYFDTVHPWANGEIIVQGSGTSSSDTAIEATLGPAFDIVYNDLLFKITGYQKDHIYFSKYYEDGVHMSTDAYTIDEFNGGDTWMSLDFGFEGEDAILEWKWYYDENYLIELDSITWNRAQATTEPTLVPITQSPFAPYNYRNSITPVPDSGTLGCETTSTGCYIPNNTTFTVGDVVTFYNSDNQSHTFTSGTPADGPNGKFNSGLLIPGESFEFSSDVSGNFPYYCTLHPWMVGMFMVEHSYFTKPSSISVFTDGISYHGKEHIEIYGHITKNTGPSFIRLTVETSSGLSVYDGFDTLNFGDYTFDRTVIPEPSWKKGTYFVTVSYGTSDHRSYDLSGDAFSRTSFEYTGYSKTSVDYVSDFDSPLDEIDNDSPLDEIDNDSPLDEIDNDSPLDEIDNDSPIGATDLDSLLDEIYNDFLFEDVDEFDTTETHEDSEENDFYNEQNFLNHKQKEIVITSKQLDSKTQNKIKTLDSKITKVQSQYDEYLKQYNYYEGKTLSVNDAKKFQMVVGKLESQNEQIDSLIDTRNTIISESEDISESLEDKAESIEFYRESIEYSVKPIEDKAEPIEDQVVSPQPGHIEVKYKKEPTCFLFWCW